MAVSADGAAQVVGVDWRSYLPLSSRQHIGIPGYEVHVSWSQHQQLVYAQVDRKGVATAWWLLQDMSKLLTVELRELGGTGIGWKLAW